MQHSNTATYNYYSLSMLLPCVCVCIHIIVLCVFAIDPQMHYNYVYQFTTGVHSLLSV